MISIEFALRDERINVCAMTIGIIHGNINHQILLCKKREIPKGRVGPFLLDAKISPPQFKLSSMGRLYERKVMKQHQQLKYVAYVEAYVKIRVKEDLFNKLRERQFFSVWDPQAPMNYFEDRPEGYLVLFRVYELDEPIPERMLAKGRKGRNYYYRLSESALARVVKPVVSDGEYGVVKQSLITLLRENGWLVYVQETGYPRP